MIITRSPMRISLGGGGTDLPSYYREFGGFLIAAAIEMPPRLINRSIICEALKLAGVQHPHLEITSMSTSRREAWAEAPYGAY
jgi:D-glycero-alpha-D-manno-heptose-7-phosphate kinase